jgi:hypothetical protein
MDPVACLFCSAHALVHYDNNYRALYLPSPIFGYCLLLRDSIPGYQHGAYILLHVLVPIQSDGCYYDPPILLFYYRTVVSEHTRQNGHRHTMIHLVPALSITARIFTRSLELDP